jgi:hypothetical protein
MNGSNGKFAAIPGRPLKAAAQSRPRSQDDGRHDHLEALM